MKVPRGTSHPYIAACAIAAFFAIVVVLVAMPAPDATHPASPMWGSIITAILGIAGIFAASEFPKRSDQRARISNSIEIARRWDQEPFLTARNKTREIKETDLVNHLEDQAVRESMIHFANYYWEIAEAIETGWADEAYIRERFRATLSSFMPCFQKLLLAQLKESDASAEEAFEAIAELHLGWKELSEKEQRPPINERVARLKERLGGA